MFSSIWVFGIWIMLILLWVNKPFTLTLFYIIYALNACFAIWSCIFYITDFILQYFKVHDYGNSFNINDTYEFFEDSWVNLSPFFASILVYLLWNIITTYIMCKVHKLYLLAFKHQQRQLQQQSQQQIYLKKPSYLLILLIFWWIVWIGPILVALSVYQIYIRYITIILAVLLILYLSYKWFIRLIFHVLAENAKLIVVLVVITAFVYCGVHWKEIRDLISK